MRQAIALIVAATLVASSAPAFAARAAGQTQQTGSLSGTASTSAGEPMASATVQLRDLATGQISGVTTSTATGQFTFAALNPGNYIVEVVNAAGQIVGTSAVVPVTAGATVTGVVVSASAAIAGATAGAGAAAGGGAATGGVSTAVIVTTVAAAAGVAGVVALTSSASPSK